VVDARFPMDELNDRLALGIPEGEEYDSVGGYVYSMLGTIPEAGATFQGGRARWTVESVNGRRILFVRLRADEPWPRDALVEAGLAPAQENGSGTPARTEAAS
jgi:CBS domain containing-hemolysin-like protein